MRDLSRTIDICLLINKQIKWLYDISGLYGAMLFIAILDLYILYVRFRFFSLGKGLPTLLSLSCCHINARTPQIIAVIVGYNIEMPVFRMLSLIGSIIVRMNEIPIQLDQK